MDLNIKFVIQLYQMLKSLKFACLLCLLGYNSKLLAQHKILIPAYTAYATPPEKEEDAMAAMDAFTEKDGLKNWVSAGKNIHFYFRARHTGQLKMVLRVKNERAGTTLGAKIAGKNFKVAVPGSKKFLPVTIGTIYIKDTGFYTLSLSAVAGKLAKIADIQSLELSGPAAQDIHFNSKPRRNAASVHLLYDVPDSMHTTGFYNEINIPVNADPVHSYYMACGFARGYFGIQVNSEKERRVIFSVWDAGNEAMDRNKVGNENKVQLAAKGESVFADGFGNEGTGGHSHWMYPWKAGETYRFYVTAVSDSASRSTSYAGYFFIPEQQQWKLIAAFKAPKDTMGLKKLYAFVENFDGSNGQLKRKAFFSNPWTRRENGEWKPITQSGFSYDATGKAGDRIDYGGGVSDNKFYLWNGGFENADAKFGDRFTIKPADQKPLIDLYKNADSIQTAGIEKEKMQAYRGSETGWQENNGVFYKVLSAGTGAKITLDDTLVVQYKGSLLNGFVFDQTKDKPATFPLKRLIRGWQYALPGNNVGSKVRLLIPSRLAYGIRNLGDIPPNSILVFDIEVLEIMGVSDRK